MEVAGRRFRAGGIALWGTLLLLGPLAGCGRQSALTLYQPHAPTPVQREIRLASSWAYFTTEGGRCNCLLAFPLPGSEGGPRDFLIYLTAPDTQGDWLVNAADANAARGFLIQAVGQMRGKTRLVEGTVRCRKELFSSEKRRLDLDVRCEDGTRITGTAYIALSSLEIQGFEKRYTRDVMLLTPPASQPAESQPATSQPTASPPAEETETPPVDTGEGGEGTASRPAATSP